MIQPLAVEEGPPFPADSPNMSSGQPLPWGLRRQSGRLKHDRRSRYCGIQELYDWLVVWKMAFL